MTSATDERGVESGYPHTLRPELHKALDAAGIDYWVAQGLTFWNCPDGRECVAYGYQADGRPTLAVKIVGLTDPAQVIAATLGPCNDSCNCTNGERTDLAAENVKLFALLKHESEQTEKLRELVRIMHSELVSCEDNGYVCGGHKFDERVRELGVGI